MSEDTPQLADIVFHAKDGILDSSLKIQSSEESVRRDIELRKSIYEKYHKPELASQLNIQRVRDFIEKETGQKVDAEIYVINKDDKALLKQEKLFIKDRYIDFSDMYDNHTHSALVFSNEDDYIFNTESRLVHELAHSTGLRVLTISTQFKDGNTDVTYQTDRLGLRTDSQHGSFLEEMFASSIERKYFEKFAETDYFKSLSRRAKRPVNSFEDVNKMTFTFPNPPVDDLKGVSVPLKYANLSKNDLTAGQSCLTAYSFDLLADVIYKKSGEDLKTIMMQTRRDPHKLKKLVDVIEGALGKGAFKILQNTTYGNPEDLPSIVSTTKYLQRAAKT